MLTVFIPIIMFFSKVTYFGKPFSAKSAHTSFFSDSFESGRSEISTLNSFRIILPKKIEVSPFQGIRSSTQNQINKVLKYTHNLGQASLQLSSETIKLFKLQN